MPFLIRVPALFARRLCLLTLLYLALPLVIFFLGWLRLLWGIPMTVLLVGVLATLAKRGWNALPDEEAPTREEGRGLLKVLLWTWVPVALMGLQIGAGGFGAATIDWENKHNLIFADLVRFPWPVIYHGPNAPPDGFMLVYYLSYYLPAAAVGKVLGWSAANVAWELWTQVGLLLICAWVVAFAGARARWLGLLFLVFSGATLLGFLLHRLDVKLLLPLIGVKEGDGSNDLGMSPSYYVLYGANIVQLFWAPQHLLGGWLSTALLLNRWNAGFSEAKSGERWDGGWGGSALLGWALSAFMSPMTAVGVLPFLLVLGVREVFRSRRGQPSVQPSSSRWLGPAIGLSSVLCLLIVGVYMLVRNAPPAGAIPQRGDHFVFLLAPLWREEGWHALWRYGTFVLAEFGLMYLLVWPRRDEPGLAPWRAPLAVGLFVLLLLPCFIYGFYNDLTMRVSIPALAILFFVVARFLQTPSVSVARRIGVLALLLCGAVMFVEYSRTSGRALRHGDWNSRRSLSTFPTMLAQYRHDPHYLLNQYTAPRTSPFARFFAK